MQSESVELRILLSWSDELTIYTLLPLHHAFHVAHTWPNSKYEDINVSGSGASEQLGGRGEHAKHAPLGWSGGMLPQENFRICML